MLTQYYIIEIESAVTKHYQSARDAAVFFLGRKINNYIAVKLDKDGARVINFESSDVTAIESSLSESIL
jgi:hypothetical protein